MIIALLLIKVHPADKNELAKNSAQETERKIQNMIIMVNEFPGLKETENVFDC